MENVLNVKSFVESKSIDDLKNEIFNCDLKDNQKLKELVFILFAEIVEMQKNSIENANIYKKFFEQSLEFGKIMAEFKNTQEDKMASFYEELVKLNKQINNILTMHQSSTDNIISLTNHMTDLYKKVNK